MRTEYRALAALSIVLQAALALLAAAGLLVFDRLGGASRPLIAPEALAIAGPVVLVLLAIGIARDWRPARVAIAGWQAVVLLGFAFSMAASRGAVASLTTALTGVGLPVAILVLVLIQPRTPIDVRRVMLSGLLLLSGLIHLSLVSQHWTSARPLALLFAIDATALVAVAILSWRSPGWRKPAAALLIGTVLAYLIALGRRIEAPDDLGIATKLIELGGLALIVWPARPRFGARLVAATTSLFLAVGLSGSVAWATSLRPAPGTHTHDGKVVLAEPPPTDLQRIAANQLVENTVQGTARFADLQVALSEGYRPTTPLTAPTVHYLNASYERRDGVLDPQHPPALVYANTRGGPFLLGAMYTAPRNRGLPSSIGGSLTEWHTHTNLCFTPAGFGMVGLRSPFGTCPVGAVSASTAPLLHVWTVANPGGPFGDLSPAYVAALVRRS